MAACLAFESNLLGQDALSYDGANSAIKSAIASSWPGSQSSHTGLSPDGNGRLTSSAVAVVVSKLPAAT